VPTDKNQFITGLVTDHGTALESFLTQKLGNREDAAELAQEAFVRLHRLENPQGLDNARAYFYRVAGNLAVDHLRRRLHCRFLATEMREAGETGTLGANTAAASPEQVLASRQRLHAINRAVDALPFRVKQAFLLHRLNGMPYSAIAEQLQVSVSSVEKYILQALRYCRAALEALDVPARVD